jgi:hypothetical protein
VQRLELRNGLGNALEVGRWSIARPVIEIVTATAAGTGG